MMKQNYGIDYPREKVMLLISMIEEAGWSEEQFKRTFQWILKTRPYPTWTVSDWFTYNVKIYPYAWYLEQVKDKGACVNKQIEVYDLGGTFGYKYIDGETLPFPRRMLGESFK